MFRKIRAKKYGYAERKIIEYLQAHEEATATELYRITNNRVEPLKNLLNRKIVYKTKNRKYILLYRWGQTELNELFQEFLIDVALDYFFKHLEDLQKQGITDIEISNPEILDTYGKLIPVFLEALREKQH